METDRKFNPGDRVVDGYGYGSGLRNRLIALGVGYTIALTLALLFFAGTSAHADFAPPPGDWRNDCLIPSGDNTIRIPAGAVIIVDDWTVNGRTVTGAQPCIPCPEENQGSSGCQVGPWMPPHVEDRGDTHQGSVKNDQASATDGLVFVADGLWIPSEVTL